MYFLPKTRRSSEQTKAVAIEICGASAVSFDLMQLVCTRARVCALCARACARAASYAKQERGLRPAAGRFFAAGGMLLSAKD